MSYFFKPPERAVFANFSQDSIKSFTNIKFFDIIIKEIHPPNFLDLMWYVYVIQSRQDNDLYVGIANDLRKRVNLHNQGKVFSTRLRAPFNIIYYEAHKNKNDAALREKFLKSGWGKNWIKRTLKNYFQSKKLGG